MAAIYIRRFDKNVELLYDGLLYMHLVSRFIKLSPETTFSLLFTLISRHSTSKLRVPIWDIQKTIVSLRVFSILEIPATKRPVNNCHNSAIVHYDIALG
jgi:hypothetical protein